MRQKFGDGFYCRQHEEYRLVKVNHNLSPILTNVSSSPQKTTSVKHANMILDAFRSTRLDDRSRRSRSVSRSRSPSYSGSRSRSRSRGRSTRSNNWISVTNLTRNVTLDHVKEIFAQYGEIVSTEFPFNSKCT